MWPYDKPELKPPRPMKGANKRELIPATHSLGDIR